MKNKRETSDKHTSQGHDGEMTMFQETRNTDES